MRLINISQGSIGAHLLPLAVLGTAALAACSSDVPPELLDWLGHGHNDPGSGHRCTVHVAMTGDNANSGSSWEHAKRDIGPALARAGDSGCDVWVQAGSYHPNPERDGTPTLELAPGVALYGGFAGHERQLGDRVLSEATASVIDGTVDADDYSYMPLIQDAAHATLDGFTVTGDRMEAPTLVSTSDSFTVRNSLFTGNYTLSSPVIQSTGASLQIVDSQFIDNDSLRAAVAGIQASGDDFLIESSHFERIGAFAVIGVTGANPRILRSTFVRNGEDGPVLAGDGLLVEDCTFERNQTAIEGANLRIHRSRFVNNDTTPIGYASGVYSTGGRTFISNSTFSGNRGFHVVLAGTGIVIDHATIAHNDAFEGTFGGAVELHNSVVWGNSPPDCPPLPASCEPPMPTVATYSMSDEGLPPGEGNLPAQDPRFVDSMRNIGADSPLRDKADPESELRVDVDGDPRDDRPDIGAQEFVEGG